MPVLLASFGANDLLVLAAAVVLLAIAAFLAVAEIGLTRVTRARAAALAEEKGRAGRLVARLVNRPERFLNPVLLVVLICQTAAAFLSALVAIHAGGGLGVAIALTLNVVLVFVFVQAMPKTWAVRNADRAALLASRPVAALAAFPPIRLVNRALMGLARAFGGGEEERGEAPV